MRGIIALTPSSEWRAASLVALPPNGFSTFQQCYTNNCDMTLRVHIQTTAVTEQFIKKKLAFTLMSMAVC